MKAILVNWLVDTATKYKDVVTVFAGLLPFILLAWKILPAARRKWREFRDQRSLQNRLGAEFYTREDFARATKFYIEPDCQDVDPGGGEDFRAVYAIRQNAFDAVDKLLSAQSEHKFAILLADSGMGKTSFLLNYYARHQRSRKRHRYSLALVPLGLPDAGERIIRIENKPGTVLFLDAFDEDTRAIEDHRERLDQILKLARDFRNVVISCRTQFFPKEEEVPRETGQLRIGPTSAMQSHEHVFYKIYLSPFSDAQVSAYLRRRFGLLHRGERKIAGQISKKIKDLTTRPMLLAHINDLLKRSDDFEFGFQIYEEMVESWLERERPFVRDKEGLRNFSELVAVDIYANRKQRGSERIASEDLLALSENNGITLQSWQLRGRSLLNRDANGKLKFAHRSIMEYLCVKRFTRAPGNFPRTEWTEQMKRFWWDMAVFYLSPSRSQNVSLPLHNQTGL